jgi:hypothetical protein
VFPLNLYARVRFFIYLCTRDRGCSAHPVFPAPSLLGGSIINNSGALRCENAEVCQNVIARSACDEAIQSLLVALDCFASLAMTVLEHIALSTVIVREGGRSSITRRQ